MGTRLALTAVLLVSALLAGCIGVSASTGPAPTEAAASITPLAEPETAAAPSPATLTTARSNGL